jgi:hypothetical protein
MSKTLFVDFKDTKVSISTDNAFYYNNDEVVHLIATDLSGNHHTIRSYEIVNNEILFTAYDNNNQYLHQDLSNMNVFRCPIEKFEE